MAESDIEGKAQRIAAYAGPGMSISASLQNATAMAKELPDLKEKLFDIRLQYARQTSNRLQVCKGGVYTCFNFMKLGSLESI